MRVWVKYKNLVTKERHIYGEACLVAQVPQTERQWRKWRACEGRAYSSVRRRISVWYRLRADSFRIMRKDICVLHKAEESWRNSWHCVKS